MAESVTYAYGHRPYIVKVSKDTVANINHTFKKDGTVHEEESVREFMKYIPIDRSVTVADVGAQAGLYTLLFKYYPLANVVAIEPNPLACRLLKENIQLNQQTNAEVIQMAASDSIGKAQLSVCSNHNGLHTLSKRPLRFSNMYTLPIETTTLDTLFYAQGRPLDFLKIDTEGWELYVLKGGRQTILHSKPLIQLEWCEMNMRQCGVSEHELAMTLQEYGYKLVSKPTQERIYMHETKMGH